MSNSAFGKTQSILHPIIGEKNFSLSRILPSADLSSFKMQGYVKRACQKAFPENVHKHCHFYDLRHSYAIHFLIMGVSVDLIANCLSESSVFDVLGKPPSKPALEIDKEMGLAESCVKAWAGLEKGWSILNELEKRTFNTAQRAKIYLKFNGALSGSVLHVPRPNKSLCK